MERYGDLKNAGPYKKYKPISSLFFMISSAIASIKSIKVNSETKVMIDENNPILTIGKYELDFNDLKTKKGTFEIYKHRKGVLNLLDYVEEYDRLGKLVLTNDDIKKIGRILDRLDHDVKEDLFGYNI
jgi:histidyl-tRNA synthetase